MTNEELKTLVANNTQEINALQKSAKEMHKQSKSH